MISTELTAKLEAFRAHLQAETVRGYIEQGYDPANHPHDCTFKVGRKYANVDRGRSGVYMVELATGEIFGIKGYGVIHKGHRYGTLDTINEWDWSGYTACRVRQVTAA